MNVTETEILDRLLHSFEAYYDVRREEVKEPFAAEAEFHSHDEQFFLVKSARLAEAESNEYVFFAAVSMLDQDTLRILDETAWERGLSRIKPHADHRNSDVTLMIIAEQISEEAFSMIPGIRRYKSYRFSLQGWSHYRLFAIEQKTGRMACNRQGQSLKKLVCNII